MRIIGIGTDIVEVVRIANMIEKHGELFLERVYTRDEILYCSARGAANQHFAGRWAAKEAVLKALGTGWTRGIHWTDIEVCSTLGGQPTINLWGEARNVSQQLGVDEVQVSISHCRALATAYALALQR